MTRKGEMPPSDIDRPETAPPPPPPKVTPPTSPPEKTQRKTGFTRIRIKTLENQVDLLHARIDDLCVQLSHLTASDRDRMAMQINIQGAHIAALSRQAEEQQKHIDSLSSNVCNLDSKAHERWQRSPHPDMVSLLFERVAKLENNG